MAEKRQEPAFTVTDRRLFTEDGELRKDVSEEAESPKAVAPPASVATAPSAAKETAPATGSVTAFPAEGDGIEGQAMPAAPTAAEQQAQADAYRESAQELDSRVELS